MDTEYRDEKGRFKEGNPGGPGRPRFSIVSLVRDELLKVDEEQKEEVARRKAREYVEKLDDVGFRDLMNRFDGQPKQSIELSGGETPIGLIFVRSGATTEDNATTSTG
jgi:hypothetical protein